MKKPTKKPTQEQALIKSIAKEAAAAEAKFLAEIADCTRRLGSSVGLTQETFADKGAISEMAIYCVGDNWGGDADWWERELTIFISQKKILKEKEAIEAQVNALNKKLSDLNDELQVLHTV